MGSFVARHDTTGGFGRPLRHYLELANELVQRARSDGAAEVLVVGEGTSPVVDAQPAIFDVLLRDRLPYRFVNGRLSAVFPLQGATVLVAPHAGEAARWYDIWPATPLVDGFHLCTGDGSWPQAGLEPVGGARLLQNGIELQAFGWNPAAAHAQFWLRWQVLWDSTSDTHFFVHLVDARGTLRGQLDSPGYPTASRRKGDRIFTIFDISMPTGVSAAPVWANVGMYVYPDVTNVPVVDASGNPIAGEVSLGPLGTVPRPQ
jgi:hypothetical protein